MSSDRINVAIWPDGTWVPLEETQDFEDALQHKSDDYKIVEVTEWEEDGSPACHYFD